MIAQMLCLHVFKVILFDSMQKKKKAARSRPDLCSFEADHSPPVRGLPGVAWREHRGGMHMLPLATGLMLRDVSPTCASWE